MPIEFAPIQGRISEKTIKDQISKSWETNSSRLPIAKSETFYNKPPIKKDVFTPLQSIENSSIFKRTMSENDIISSQDISPEGEVAHLSHKDKVFRAMHGGSKPEMKVEDTEFDLEGLLDEDSGHEKDPEALAKKLGPELKMELRPFRAASKGKEHIVLENKDETKLVKVDKFSADEDVREEKAKTYKVLEELFPDRLPHSELFSKDGETGVIVDKVQVHPQFEEARTAAKKGNPKLWNEITRSYFSDVMDEANEMGIDLWNSIDADERDNFVTNKEKEQIFVDDFWVEGKDILAVKDRIIGRMRAKAEKYPLTQQVKVMDALKDLEKFAESKNQPKAADKTITRQFEHA